MQDARVRCRMAMRGRGPAVTAAAVMAILLLLSLSGFHGNSFEHTEAHKREQLRLLRLALKANMEEYLGKGTGDTFIPDGKVQRVVTMTKLDYNFYAESSRPFILSSPDWNCTKHEWSFEFIRKVAGDDVVGIETSKSNRFYSNDRLQKVRMSVSEFLDAFTDTKRKLDYYLAEENTKQFPGIHNDINEPTFSEDHNLDKTQLWIGAGGQVSPLHHDQWDNILCQIKGSRKITLYDPFESDKLYPYAGVSRHFAQVDPEHPDYAKFPNFAKATAHNLTLSAGEILFLPAHWWHQIRHTSTSNVALNFWYTPNLMSELIMDTILPEGDNY